MRQTSETGMIILLLYHLGDRNIEAWMLPGTPGIMKCLPAHFDFEQLPQLVFSDILTKILHTEALNRILYHRFLAKAMIHDGNVH